MPTCWFCNKRPADPGSTWTTRLYWTRPKSTPPPLTHDDIIVATENIRQIDIRLPRCPACRHRARQPAVMNAIGIAAGAATFLFTVALWAKLSTQGLPRIAGTWYPLAAIATVAGGLLGGLCARLYHPSPTRRSWSDHPSMRLLAAEGWTGSPRSG